MRVETKKQWYAIYTRPKWEKRVADLLVKKKIQVYYPLTTRSAHWSDRKKSIAEPLFPSYVFVYIPDSEEKMSDIKKTDGVINFIHWLSKPAVIPPDEIETIKKFLAEYEYATIEKSDVKPSDRVKIINGPLMMWEGNIIEIKTNTIKIMLPSLGYSLIADVRRDHLEEVTTLQGVKIKVI